MNQQPARPKKRRIAAAAAGNRTGGAGPLDAIGAQVANAQQRFRSGPRTVTSCTRQATAECSAPFEAFRGAPFQDSFFFGRADGRVSERGSATVVVGWSSPGFAPPPPPPPPPPGDTDDDAGLAIESPSVAPQAELT